MKLRSCPRQTLLRICATKNHLGNVRVVMLPERSRAKRWSASFDQDSGSLIGSCIVPQLSLARYTYIEGHRERADRVLVSSRLGTKDKCPASAMIPKRSILEARVEMTFNQLKEWANTRHWHRLRLINLFTPKLYNAQTISSLPKCSVRLHQDN